MLEAAKRGRPEAVTTFLLEGASPSALRALLRSWTAAQHGTTASAGGGSGDVTDAADAAAADAELLFYVSTEGDMGAVAASSGG